MTGDGLWDAVRAQYHSTLSRATYQKKIVRSHRPETASMVADWYNRFSCRGLPRSIACPAGCGQALICTQNVSGLFVFGHRAWSSAVTAQTPWARRDQVESDRQRQTRVVNGDTAGQARGTTSYDVDNPLPSLAGGSRKTRFSPDVCLLVSLYTFFCTEVAQVNAARVNRREGGTPSSWAAQSRVFLRKEGVVHMFAGTRVGSTGHLLKMPCVSSNRSLQGSGVQGQSASHFCNRVACLREKVHFFSGSGGTACRQRRTHSLSSGHTSF